MKTKMTIQDASKELGLSVDAIRKRLQRGTIKGKKNKQGRWIVEVDQEQGEDINKDKVYETSSNELVMSMRDEIEYLRKENERKDHIIMNLTTRIPQLAAPKVKKAFFAKIFKSDKKEV